MRLIASPLAIAACLALAGCKSEDDEAREMLAAALQDYAIVGEEEQPIDARLAAAQTALGALDRIVQDYATTDLGLQLAAGGTVGEISVTELQRQIAALEVRREFEACDVTPTPGCVVDHLVADMRIADRPQLYDLLEGPSALLVALATAAPDDAADLLHRVDNAAFKAYAIASAPQAALDDGLVADTIAELDDRAADLAAVIAAWRVLRGQDDPARRRLAEAGPSGRALLEIFGTDRSVIETAQLLDAMADDGRLNYDSVQEAASLMANIEGLRIDSLPLALMIDRHGAAETVAGLRGDLSDDYDDMVPLFGAEAALASITTTLADPEADPRALSLALMAATVHLPETDLRAAVDGLAGREMMQWDNVRVYPGFVSLGYLGDRALFDTVLALLTPETIHADMEGAWQTGRQLADGQVAEPALNDPRLFRAAVDVASARGTAEQLAAFLRDAVAKAGDRAGEFGGPTNRIDIVSAARRCGLPEIVQAINATLDDFDRVFGTCDRDRLGTRFDTMTQEAFDIYVNQADLFADDAFDIIDATRTTAPARSYAFVRALANAESRVNLTAVLAYKMAQP